MESEMRPKSEMRPMSLWLLRQILRATWKAFRMRDRLILDSELRQWAKNVHESWMRDRAEVSSLNEQANRLMRQNRELLQAFRSKMSRKARATNFSRIQLENDILREEYARISAENRKLLEKDVEADDEKTTD